jgi:hypothetical protein
MRLVRYSSVMVALFGSSAALLIGTAAQAATDAAAGGRPKLEISETTRDGGTVEEGTICPFRFTVANRGQADLLIDQVKPSCGCTVPTWERVVKPGTEAVIKAEMNTEYLRGAVIKHLTVSSNDPDRPTLELTITAHVNPLVQITPAPSALLTVEDKAVSHEFTLERAGGRPMSILEVIPNSRFLATQTTPLPGQGRFKLAVTATADTPYGRSTVPVVVRTDMDKGGMLMLVLTIDRGIVTEPPVVFLGLLTEATQLPLSSQLSVTRRSGSFHVKSVAVDDPKLTTRLETVKEGAEYRVTVSYAGGWDAGVKRRTLTLTTDDAQQPSITVPVQAIMQAKNSASLPAAGR